jgi:phage-related protein
MQELFQLFGVLGIKTDEAFKQIDEVENRVKELARKWASELTGEVNIQDNASDSLQNISDSAEQTAKRLQQLENILKEIDKQLDSALKGSVDVDSTSLQQTRQEIQQLMQEIENARRSLNESINIDSNVDSNVNVTSNVQELRNHIAELQRQLESLQQEIAKALDAEFNPTDNTITEFQNLNNHVKQLLDSLKMVERELERINQLIQQLDGSQIDITQNVNNNGNVGQTSPATGANNTVPPQPGQSNASTLPRALLDAINALSREIDQLRQEIARMNGNANNNTTSRTLFGGVPGGAGTGQPAPGTGQAGAGTTHHTFTPLPVTNRFGYDANRVLNMQRQMDLQMMRLAQMLDPKNVLGRVAERLEVGGHAFTHLPQAKNHMMAQAAFGAAMSGISSARMELTRLGFGRTKQEIKALEAQLYNLGNYQLDHLRDQIKLTEKALKEMKSAANADEFAEEIKLAEEKLKEYQRLLKENNPFEHLARVNGYEAHKIFGKDVMVKPFKDSLERMGAMLQGFANRDLAMLANKTYDTIDKAAKAIIGPQTTKMEERMKITQLQTRYQMLGQMINTFVTPAVLGLAAAFALVGKNAEEGWTKFQAQTLTTDKDMKDFKELITDTAVQTGATHEEVGLLFSVLHNQMGRTKANIKESATLGLYFKKVWGVDAVQAISTIDKITQELGVSQKQASDILALALKEYQGDLNAATKDVLAHGDAWKKATKEGTEGAKAYERMVHGIDNGAINAFARAFRQIGAAMLELWKQLEPTLEAVADKIYKAAKAMTEFFREHPHVAKFLAHVMLLGGAFTVLLGVLAPVAGFMIMYRNLFQGLAQTIAAFSKGGTAVLNPVVRMLFDMMTMTRNAVLGLPRVIAGIIPGVLTMLRALPGALMSAAVQFVKLNPLLSIFMALWWVIYKNWERFEPVMKSIWDSLKRIGNAIIEAFAGPGKSGMEGFQIIMDKIAKFLGDVLLPLFKLLAEVLEVVAVVMENGGGKFVAAGAAMLLFGNILGGVLPKLGRFGSAIKSVIGIFGKIGPFITGLGPKILKVLGLIRKIGPALRLAGTAMMGPWGIAIAALVTGAVLIYKNWDKIVAFFKKVDLKKIGKSIGEGLIQGLKLALAWSPVGLIWRFIVKPIMKALGINSPSKLFMQFGKWLIEGLIIGIKSGFQLLAGIFAPLGSLFRNAFNSIISVARSTGASIRNAVVSVWNGIRTFLSNTWSSIRNGASTFLNSIRNAISRAWSAVRQNTTAVFNSIRNFLRNAWNSIRQTVVSIANSIRSSLVNIWNGIRSRISSIASGLRSFLINAWNRIRSSIVSAANSIRNAVVNAWNRIRSATSSAVSYMRNAVSNAFNRIVSAARRFGSTLRSVLNNAWSSLKSMGKKAYSWGRNIVEGLVNGIRSIAGRVVRAARSVANSIKRAITGALGINSPSRVTMGYGVNVGEGFAIGMDKTVGMVAKAANALTSVIQPPEIVEPSVALSGNLGTAMSSLNAVNSGIARVAPTSSQTINNNTTNNNDRGVVIQNATFELKVEKLHSAEDVVKLRKVIQNVVSDDLFGMAVRNV